MADKYVVWEKGHWYKDDARRAWCFTKPGMYEPGAEQEILLSIDLQQIMTLIPALDEDGWIKPRLDERLRAEDLKITHRLLDIIENGAGKGK